MYIEFAHPQEALPNYFHYYFEKQKVGLVTSIVGSIFLKTGTGKSYTALRLGELIDKDFNIDKVVYYPREFLKVMDDVEESGKPSQVVVVDEGEITAPAQLWYSFTNKAIAYNLATFRYLRCMSIFVTPALSWLDKRVRILTSHIGFTEKFFGDWKTGLKKTTVHLRLYRITTDMIGEKIFFRKIRMFDTTNRKIVSFRRFVVSLPSEDLIEAYEKKARKFKKSLRKGLVKEIERFEKYQGRKVLEEKKDLKKLVDIAIERPLIRQELEEKGKVSTSVVRYEMSEYNLTFREASMLAKLIKMLWKGKHG